MQEDTLTEIIPAALPPGMGMRYFEEVLDRKTGDLVSVDRGDWITLEELSRLLGTGRRQMTAVLREMDFLQLEGAGRDVRHRISPWVEEKGWGRRNRRKTDKFPFDVISPEAVRWVMTRWEEAARTVEGRTQVQPVAEARAALAHFKTSRDREDMKCVQEVYWLVDHFPGLTHEQMASVLDVSRQLVDRYIKERMKQRRKWLDLKATCPDPRE